LKTEKTSIRILVIVFLICILFAVILALNYVYAYLAAIMPIRNWMFVKVAVMTGYGAATGWCIDAFLSRGADIRTKKVFIIGLIIVSSGFYLCWAFFLQFVTKGEFILYSPSEMWDQIVELSKVRKIIETEYNSEHYPLTTIYTGWHLYVGWFSEYICTIITTSTFIIALPRKREENREKEI